MTVREMFELIENLVDEYGIEKVEYTIDSIFDTLRNWKGETKC